MKTTASTPSPSDPRWDGFQALGGVILAALGLGLLSTDFLSLPAAVGAGLLLAGILVLATFFLPKEKTK